MNSGDHSTSYVPSRDIDFPSADGGVSVTKNRGKAVRLLITKRYLPALELL
jgi:hypothetical protein